MGIRNIFFEGDPILYKPCREVEDFNSRLHGIMDDLRDTMLHFKALGLSGPHIGILKRIISMNVDGQIIEIVNPVILHRAGVQMKPEGSVSSPGQSVVTVRPMHVQVEGKDRNGNKVEMNFSDLYARVVCHEIDQTNGVFFKYKSASVLN